jgi:tetratricopeptide (TPR) repeat protein
MAYAKTSLRREKRELRDKMRAMGLGYRDIAGEFVRRYGLRPRAAWREAYGWSLQEAAERINSFTGQTSLDPGGFAGMTGPHLCEHEGWPGPGAAASGRRPTPYLLALLAAVYGCAVGDLVDLADRKHLPPADLLILDTYTQPRADAGTTVEPASQLESSPSPLDIRGNRYAIAGPLGNPATDITLHRDLPTSPALPHVTYRWFQEPVLGDSWIGREVEMAAHEGSDHAEHAEAHGIGAATLEQLRADLVRLSRLTDTGEPFPVFTEMRRVRGRIYRLLDRRLWPREQTDLYFLLGCLNGLMGVTANRLGYPDAAEELNRAGSAYAHAIDHRPLMAVLRDELGFYAYCRGRFEESRELALSGLQYVSAGPHGARLHICHARAAARLGDADAARQAVRDAHEARDRDYNDELLEIGGSYLISEATHYGEAGAALTAAAGAGREAAAELERAIGLYDQGPGQGEVHWFAGKPLAGIDLAVVRLRSGALDAATAALEPALSLPTAQRISRVTMRLAAARDELAAPVFHGSPQARDLGAQIEEFGGEAVTAGLHSLSG